MPIPTIRLPASGGLSPAQREMEVARIVQTCAEEITRGDADMKNFEDVHRIVRARVCEIRLILDQEKLAEGYKNATKNAFAKRGAIKKARGK